MINHSITIPHIIESEIFSVIKLLENIGAGYDAIPASIARQQINSYIKPLSYLINKSIFNEIFLTKFKLAEVIPIFKSGPSIEISNYPSISVLSFFKKIFEKMVYTITSLTLLINITYYINFILDFVKDI